MDKPPANPELSVIVPLYNEAGTIEGLFRTLKAQNDVEFELVCCDGGSTDATAEQIRLLAAAAPFPVVFTGCGQGRGRQLNCGVAASRGDLLLMLHADSTFADRYALRKGLDLLTAAMTAKGDDRLAGHFALRFDCDSSRSPGYYYYESKARLDRSGCTHGDQGILLPRSFFAACGPFDETLPMLEDTYLAETIRRRGQWLLLPAEILTSARRFEREGLTERQTLNAIILNFAAIGRNDFLREIPGIYSSQDRTSRLRLAPFFRRFRELIQRLPRRERLRLWYDTGTYVRSNAWQLAFALDCRRNFRRGVLSGEGQTMWLHIHDRYLDRLTDHFPGRLAATMLVRLWFQLSCLALALRERLESGSKRD